MATFQRRPWLTRYTMSGLLSLQRIRALAVTREDLGILINNTWTRVPWHKIEQAKLVQTEQFPPISRYQNVGTNRSPREAIRLMEERRARGPEERGRSVRRAIIQTWEHIEWRAHGKKYKINTTDFAPDFENNLMLRTLLLEKMRPERLRITMWQRPSTWIGLVLLFLFLWIMVTNG